MLVLIFLWSQPIYAAVDLSLQGIVGATATHFYLPFISLISCIKCWYDQLRVSLIWIGKVELQAAKLRHSIVHLDGFDPEARLEPKRLLTL